MGNFEAVIVQVGNTQNELQVLIIIKTMLAFLALGAHEIVALFPNAQGMGLNAGKIFNIPDGKNVHNGVTNSKIL
jgi:hypothetical protein